MPPRSVRIKANERVFLAGKTGSGKTFLAEHLLRPFSRLVVVDTKGTLSKWNLEPYDGTSRSLLRRDEPARARVTFEAVDVEEELERLFLFLYEEVRFNFVLYIDEVYGVVDFGGKPSPGLTALYTRGREFGIGVWSATQRPVGVPLIMKSEAEHHFMFRLVLRDDRRHMGEFLGPLVAESIIPDEHGFFYKRIDWETAIYTPRFDPQAQQEYTNGRRSGEVSSTRRRTLPRLRA